jgi:hypothetical protein
MGNEKEQEQWPPSHKFKDPGPPIAAPDFEPRSFGNPERLLEAAFLRAGRDYGGRLSAAPIAISSASAPTTSSDDAFDALASRLCDRRRSRDREHARGPAGPSGERQNSLENSM